MNNRIWSMLLPACLAGLSATAQNYVLPASAFDEAAAATQMEPGTAVIHGTAFIKGKRGINVADKGDNLMLFPLTPYFQEYLELKKKNTRKKVATISDVAYTYRIEGKYLSEKGEFEFRGLKPGKYYIQTYIMVDRRRTVNVQTGSKGWFNVYQGTFGVEPVYTAYWQHYQVEDEVGSIVEVRSPGEVVNIVVSK